MLGYTRYDNREQWGLLHQLLLRCPIQNEITQSASPLAIESILRAITILSAPLIFARILGQEALHGLPN